MNKPLPVFKTNVTGHLPDHMQKISHLLVHLQGMLTELDEELDRENQAIRQRDTKRLLAVTNAKIVLLQSIESASNALSAMMIEHGYQDQNMGVNKGALAFELGEIWTEFCDKLESSHTKNAINARAIELSRVTTDRIIDMLRGKNKSVYGRGGKMQDDSEIATLAEA